MAKLRDRLRHKGSNKVCRVIARFEVRSDRGQDRKALELTRPWLKTNPDKKWFYLLFNDGSGFWCPKTWIERDYEPALKAVT